MVISWLLAVPSGWGWGQILGTALHHVTLTKLQDEYREAKDFCGWCNAILGEEATRINHSTQRRKTRNVFTKQVGSRGKAFLFKQFLFKHAYVLAPSLCTEYIPVKISVSSC